MAETLRSATRNPKTALRSRHLHPVIWFCPESEPALPYPRARRGVLREFRGKRSVPPTPSAHCARSREAGPSAHPPPAQKDCGGVGANGRRRLDAPAQSVPASPIGKSCTDDGRTSRLAYLRRRIFAPRWGLCLRTGRRLTRTTRSLLRSSTAFTAPNRRGPGRPDPLSSEARSSRRTQAAAPVTNAVSRSNRLSDTPAPLSSGPLPRSVCAAQQTPRAHRS